jgi:large subunit ribosomal protein L24
MKSLKFKRKIKEAASSSKTMRSGDQVIALTGDDRGQVGTVLSIKGTKVLVRGLNVHKKHVKPTELNPKGGIVDREMPIHVSNLRICVDGKPVKLKTRNTVDGSRELYYMNGESAVSYRLIKK